ncbi:MAG: hypothetical protein IPH35_08985 [Rhodoferax sp.]|nr:hypothetical protein [Rhodoferax sp.]
MKHTSIHVAQWKTSSFGQSADTSPVDLDALQEHLTVCRKPQRAAFILQQSAKVLGGFLTARVMTTLVVASLLATAFLRAW